MAYDPGRRPSFRAVLRDLNGLITSGAGRAREGPGRGWGPGGGGARWEGRGPAGQGRGPVERGGPGWGGAGPGGEGAGPGGAGPGWGGGGARWGGGGAREGGADPGGARPVCSGRLTVGAKKLQRQTGLKTPHAPVCTVAQAASPGTTPASPSRALGFCFVNLFCGHDVLIGGDPGSQAVVTVMAPASREVPTGWCAQGTVFGCGSQRVSSG